MSGVFQTFFYSIYYKLLYMANKEFDNKNCRCYIKDKNDQYYYGTDSLGNYEWGNDLNKVKLFTAKSAEFFIIVTSRKNPDNKYWIGVKTE